MKIENFLKGRMAETLIEELLRQSGNVVYRFGYEAIVQNLSQLKRSFDRYGKVGKQIRTIPDFIVINKKGDPIFVEVKFRWKPEIDERDNKEINDVANFWGAEVIFVNCWQQPYFRIASPPYFKDKKLIAKPLISNTTLGIDKYIYNECEELVHKYLTPTLVPAKK